MAKIPTERAARKLVKAVRAVKRATGAVCRSPKRKRARVDRRERLLEKLRAEGFEDKDVARFIRPDGSIGGVGLDHVTRRALENVAAGRPIDAAPEYRPSGREGRTFGERLDRSASVHEFRERVSGRSYSNPRKAKRIRAAGRALELEVRGQELVGAFGKGAAELGHALKLYRRWSGRDPGGVRIAKVPAGTPAVLVELGELSDIGYRSDKWGGRHKFYIHRTKRPRPVLYSTPDGRQVVILGGNLNVRSEGLVG